MDWLSLYFELPVFQEQFASVVGCPFKKLYVGMTLYADVVNRNAIVQHANEVSFYYRNAMPEAESHVSMTKEEASRVMLEFDLVHLVLRPEMITSIDHVSYAISRALTNVINQKVHSISFASEVIYMMGGSSNVTKCMDEMCVQPGENDDNCKWMLIVTISKAKYFGNIDNMVRGFQLPIEKLVGISDAEKIIKAFKCSQEELALPGGLNACVLMRIATKRI